MRKKILIVVVLSLLFLTYKFLVPERQYFLCNRGYTGFEYTKDDENKTTFITSNIEVDLNVKKYLFGTFYEVNSYKKNECHINNDVELNCDNELNDSHIELNLYSGKYSEDSKNHFGKSGRNYKNNWTCELKVRLVN